MGRLFRLLWLLLLTGAAHAERYLFTNGTLITMGPQGVIEGDLLVEDGRIAAVGDVPFDWDEKHVVYLDGGYLMPGLAEMHAHVPRPDRDPQYLRDVLFLWSAWGVTTARGMLGHESHLGLRADLEAHREFGPRLVTSGPSFNGRSVSVSNTAQAVSMVREQHKAGYDFLKIHPGVPLDAYLAIASTARELDMPFAGHVPVEVGLLRAIEQGQATIDHVDGFVHALVRDLTADTPGYGSFFGMGLVDRVDLELLPSLIDATREAQVWVVPTETLLENIAGDLDELMSRQDVLYLPEALLSAYRQRVTGNSASAKELVRLRKQIIRALHEAGAGLLLGSDSPQIFNVPGLSIHRELQSMVAAGLTPLEALATGTVNAARFLDMEDEFGRIATGLSADLVYVGSNPLDDIGNTSDIRGVMIRGEWLNASERSSRLFEIRKRYADQR